MYAIEIQSRAELERLLRLCVEDVKNEIAKKRAENRVLMHSKLYLNCVFLIYAGLKKKGGVDELGLTSEDREKIIEVLLSQERVLTLLYDKTFPPRLNTKGIADGINYGIINDIAGEVQKPQEISSSFEEDDYQVPLTHNI